MEYEKSSIQEQKIDNGLCSSEANRQTRKHEKNYQ